MTLAQTENRLTPDMTPQMAMAGAMRLARQARGPIHPPLARSPHPARNPLHTGGQHP